MQLASGCAAGQTGVDCAVNAMLLIAAALALLLLIYLFLALLRPEWF